MKHHSDEVSGRSLVSKIQVSSDTIGHIIRNPVLCHLDIAFY